MQEKAKNKDLMTYLQHLLKNKKRLIINRTLSGLQDPAMSRC